MSTETTDVRFDSSQSPLEPVSRLRQLDGLRGLAAFVVVLSHLYQVAAPQLGTEVPGSALWWLDATPFALFTAGHESVLIFFVLSGLVVALPALQGRAAWPAYYVSRAVRLYLPVIGAVLLACVWIVLFPRNLSQVTANTWMSNTHALTISIPQAITEATLVKSKDYAVDNVLWSLHFEVIFSIALPVFVALAFGLRAIVRRWWIGATVATAVAVCVGSVLRDDELLYLPVFFFGTIMAAELPRIVAWARRRTRLFWTAIFVLSVLVLIAAHLDSGLLNHESRKHLVVYGLSALGAAGVVFSAIGFRPFERLLLTRPIRFLGKVSFSLYLVHVPVIGTVGFAVGDHRWWLVAVIALPASIVVAWLFYLVVERPSHHLARWLGRAIGPRRAAPAAVHPTS